MKKVMRIFGRVIYLFASKMPESTSRNTFGEKVFSSFVEGLL